MSHLHRILQCVTLIAASAAVLAQSTHGVITGVITDQSAAIVRNATVTATDTNTSAARTVQSNDRGEFRFDDLEPGTYSVSVTSDGFSRYERTDLVLLPRAEVTVDAQLQVAGAANTAVEVTGTPVVSEMLTISDSKSGDVIDSLPLNFRATSSPSPIVVAPLTAGVETDSNGNISISGQLPTATSYTLDGISTQLPRYGGPTRDLFPSVEGISEFQVNTASNNAEYAQPSDISAISRSGSNDLHGSGFWYFQRQAFNSVDPISGIIPTGDADDYGGSIGGPVFIPHAYNGRNKTFFYFDYERDQLSENSLISTFTPPASWRTGDFSASGATIIDPTTGKPFPGNVIPANRINPVSAKALPLFFPNPTNSASLLTSPNLVEPYPATYNNRVLDIRLDHEFNANNRIWGRVTQRPINAVGTDAALGAGGQGDASYNPLMGPFTTGSSLYNIAVSFSRIFRPNLINEYRIGYSIADFTFSYPQAAQGNSIIQQLGIPGLPGAPVNGLGGVPVFYVGDFLGGQTNPYGHPRVNKNGTFDTGDNVSWILGRHSVKMGFDFRRLNYEDNITFLLGDEYGDYFFSGLFTAPRGTTPGDPNSFADFLLGFVSDARQAQNGPDGKPYGYQYGMFLQDEWRIHPNLILTYGLRYEVNPPFNDATDQLGNFDRNYPGGRLVIQNSETPLVSPAWRAEVGDTPFVTAGQVGLPDTLRYTYFGNIQPRLGIAWNPTGNEKTVIRASGGIYSVPILGAVLYSLLGVDTSNFADFESSAASPRIFPDVFTGSSTIASYPSYRRANEYNLKDPRVITWNFSIDHDLGWGTLARASYNGSHTYNLIYSPDLNQVYPNTFGYDALTATPALRAQNLKYPNFAEVLTRDNGPSAKYEAVTGELNKRFSSGLTFANNFTWAKNITNALGDAPTSAIPLGGQGDNGENVLDYYNIAQDEGNAYYTPRYRFVSTIVYELPFGRGKQFMGDVSRAANLFVGGWNVTGVTLAQTGPWLTPYFSSSISDPSGTNPSQRSVGNQRPDCISGQNGYLSNPTTADYFNVNAFSIPANDIGRFGSCGVGILEGPGTTTFSMSAGKTFQLAERFGIRYEAQFANLFNIENKGAPNMNVGSTGFGQISSSQLVSQAGPRTIQMMLRVIF